MKINKATLYWAYQRRGARKTKDVTDHAKTRVMSYSTERAHTCRLPHRDKRTEGSSSDEENSRYTNLFCSYAPNKQVEV